MKNNLIATILMAATIALTGCGKDEPAAEPQGFVLPQKATPMSMSESLTTAPVKKTFEVPAKPFEEYQPITGNKLFMAAQAGGFYKFSSQNFRFVTAYNEKDQGLDVWYRLNGTTGPYGDLGVTLESVNGGDFMFIPGTKEAFATAETFNLYVQLESINLNVPTAKGLITKLEVVDKDGKVLGSKVLTK